MSNETDTKLSACWVLFLLTMFLPIGLVIREREFQNDEMINTTT